MILTAFVAVCYAFGDEGFRPTFFQRVGAGFRVLMEFLWFVARFVLVGLLTIGGIIAILYHFTPNPSSDPDFKVISVDKTQK